MMENNSIINSKILYIFYSQASTRQSSRVPRHCSFFLHPLTVPLIGGWVTISSETPTHFRIHPSLNFYGLRGNSRRIHHLCDMTAIIIYWYVVIFLFFVCRCTFTPFLPILFPPLRDMANDELSKAFMSFTLVYIFFFIYRNCQRISCTFRIELQVHSTGWNFFPLFGICTETSLLMVLFSLTTKGWGKRFISHLLPSRNV